MADFKITNNVTKISPQSINPLVPIAKNIDEKWLDLDIDIVISDSLRIAPIVLDFSYSVPSIIEYTLRGDATNLYIPINDGTPLTGGQSTFVRVLNGDKLNFRAKLAGNLNRAIVGEP